MNYLKKYNTFEEYNTDKDNLPSPSIAYVLSTNTIYYNGDGYNNQSVIADGDTIIYNTDLIYLKKDGNIYPVSHPDLSTQPSILPQRYGNLDIKEVLYNYQFEFDLSSMIIFYVGTIASGSRPTGKHLFINNDNPNVATFNPNLETDQIMEFAFMNTHYMPSDEGGFSLYDMHGDQVINYHDDLFYAFKISNDLTENIFMIPLNDNSDSTQRMICFNYFILVNGDVEDLDTISRLLVTNVLGVYEMYVYDSVDLNVANSRLADASISRNYGIKLKDLCEIPKDAIIIEASSFNSNACVPAICKKENGHWNITNNEGIVPDFTLVRYVGVDKGYYYSTSETTEDDPYNGHKYVDLGLPSGTLWATKNVGATSPSDPGLYFQWGDTQGYAASDVGSGEGQKYFSMGDYKYGSEDGISMVKYNDNDSLTTLESSDDAARVNMRGAWHIPTMEQFAELINNTSITSVPGGILFESILNNETLYIPDCCVCYNGNKSTETYKYCIWSAYVATDGNAFVQTDKGNTSIHRWFGLPVRGVINRNSL